MFELIELFVEIVHIKIVHVLHPTHVHMHIGCYCAAAQINNKNTKMKWNMKRLFSGFIFPQFNLHSIIKHKTFTLLYRILCDNCRVKKTRVFPREKTNIEKKTDNHKIAETKKKKYVAAAKPQTELANKWTWTKRKTGFERAFNRCLSFWSMLIYQYLLSAICLLSVYVSVLMSFLK